MNKKIKADRELKILRKLNDVPPSRIVASLYDYEEKHLEQVVNSRKFNGYVKVFEDSFTDFMKAVNTLNYSKKKDWGDHHTVQAVLFSKIPQTLFSSFEEITRGNYEQGIGVLRIAYESLLRVLFVHKYPGEMWSAIVNRKGCRQFSASKLLTEDYKIIGDDVLYRVLSYPIHGLRHKVASELVNGHKTGSLTLNLGYTGMDDKSMSQAINLLMSVTYFAVRIFIGIFGDLLKDFRLPRYKGLTLIMKLSELHIHLKTVALILKKL
jgi:hypothetical protein